MARRRCKGVTQGGEKCKAWPLRGTDWCAAHPLSPGSTRFGSPEQASAAGKLGGRPRLPRPHEVMRERIEADLDAILAPYFEAVKEAVMFVKYEGELIVTETPDLAGRMAAAEKLLDRVYGKPAQALELGGPAGGPIEISATPDLSRLSVQEKRSLIELLDKADAGTER